MNFTLINSIGDLLFILRQSESQCCFQNSKKRCIKSTCGIYIKQLHIFCDNYYKNTCAGWAIWTRPGKFGGFEADNGPWAAADAAFITSRMFDE